MKEEMKRLDELDMKQLADSIAELFHEQLGGSFSVAISKMQMQKNRTVVGAYSGIEITATATDETFGDRLRGGTPYTAAEVAEYVLKNEKGESEVTKTVPIRS